MKIVITWATFLLLLSFNVSSKVTVKVFNWYDFNEQKLSYYKSLGYTHVFVYIGISDSDRSLFSHSTGSWIYNKGNYTTGNMSLKFKAHKEMAERHGLIPIPILESLSHVNDLTDLDKTLPESDQSISEFNLSYSKPTISQLNTIYPCTVGWSDEIIKIYNTYDGIAAIDDNGKNKSEDELVGELLKIIKGNYGTSNPEYIHIGHDELGCACACFIKLGKSRTSSRTPAQLVAAEVNQRLTQIDGIFGSSQKVFLYGDSFVPGDYGETYGIAGNLSNGDNGALKIIDKVYGKKSRLVVLPWVFCFTEGFFDRSRNLNFKKVKQLAYLDKLGYKYIPCAGEDAKPQDVPIDWVIQTTFEWVQASQMYPNNLLGFGHLTYVDFTTNAFINSQTVYTCYGAPVLAYFGWTYGERSLKLARNNSCSPKILSKVNFIKSRNDQSWIEGTHYEKLP